MSAIKSHFDEIYAKHPQAFGSPMQWVEVLPLLLGAMEGSHKNVLDLAAGQGRHALLFARAGFLVTAVDFSTYGLSAMDAAVEAERLPVETLVADIAEWKIPRTYTAIICTAALHCIQQEKALARIRTMKENTVPRGYNLISAFMDEGEMFAANPINLQYWWPSQGELRRLYADWEIVGYEEVSTQCRQRKPNGSPVSNLAANILARRPQ